MVALNATNGIGNALDWASILPPMPSRTSIIEAIRQPALFGAALMGNVANLNKALAAGAGVNAVDGTTNKPALLYAVVGNRLNTVNALLAVSGIDKDAVDGYGLTALHYAVEYYDSVTPDYSAIIAVLLAAGVNVNPASDFGGSALISAAKNDKTNLVTTLCDAGAYVNYVDGEGYTALMHAADNDNTTTVTTLLDQANTTLDLTLALSSWNAYLNATNTSRWQTALMFSADNGNDTIFDALCASGANQNQLDKRQRSILVYASNGGSLHIVSALLTAGVNVNVIDTSGWGPLLSAASNDKNDVVDAFLAAGADANPVDEDGYTALTYAIENENDYIAKKLLTASVVHTCPICRATDTFNHFGDCNLERLSEIRRKGVRCPTCLSLERHRALWLFAYVYPEISKRLFGTTEEDAVTSYIENVSTSTVKDTLSHDNLVFIKNNTIVASIPITTINYANDVVALLQDIPSDCDAVICPNILEHLASPTVEQNVIATIYSKLTADGFALFQVPLFTKIDEVIDPATDESIQAAADYVWCHKRRHGSADFADRLVANGVSITPYPINDLSGTLVFPGGYNPPTSQPELSSWPSGSVLENITQGDFGIYFGLGHDLAGFESCALKPDREGLNGDWMAQETVFYCSKSGNALVSRFPPE